MHDSTFASILTVDLLTLILSITSTEAGSFDAVFFFLNIFQRKQFLIHHVNYLLGR